MEFSVLGTVRAFGADGVVRLVRSQARLLGRLLCSPNVPVAAGTLGTELWAEADNAGRRLQLLVHRLRKALGEHDRIVHEQGGYALRVSPDELDSEVFASLVRTGAEAWSAGAPDHAAEVFRVALGRWRGEAFSGLADVPEIALEAARLEELRLTAYEQLYAVELVRGKAADVVPGLSEHARRNPLRERFGALLMIALQQCDRRAEALEAYEHTRRVLVDELGLKPGAELRRVHAAILDDQVPDLGAFGYDQVVRVSMPETDDGRGSPPLQLPPDAAGFAGREAELDELTRLVRAGSGSGTRPQLVVVTGSPGIGKTTLAVHFAHQVADQYPGGQVYVDLRGHAEGRPISPAAALETVLRALGVRPSDLPLGVDERSAMLRSRLARERLILVLDNARGPEQIRPLLPAADCLVLVTSRDQLRGLVVNDGAYRLTLDVLAQDDALRVLTETIGADRAATDASSVADLAQLCGGIPLALRIAGERATWVDRQPLAEVARELAAERNRLDQFGRTGDASADLRSVFSWSYRALDLEVSRTFRLLSLHPGRVLSLPAAAALVGEGAGRTRRLLDRLVAVHLLRQPQADRYEFHDLLRLYAAELVEQTEHETVRGQAHRRVLDWYLHTASGARDLLRPRPDGHLVVEPKESTVDPLTFATAADGVAWCERERPALIDAVAAASALGFDEHAWKLAWCLNPFFDLQCYLDDWIATGSIGLEAAERLGDGFAVAMAGNSLGTAYLSSSRHDESLRTYHRALAASREAGDVAQEVAVLTNLGFAHLQLGGRREAIDHLEHALGAGDVDEFFTSGVYLNLAASYVAVGDHVEAVRYADRALSIFRRESNLPHSALALAHLAEAYLNLNHVAAASAACDEALALLRQLGAKQGMANALTVRGRIHLARGDVAAARAEWIEARTHLRLEETRRVEELDRLLDGLNGHSSLRRDRPTS